MSPLEKDQEKMYSAILEERVKWLEEEVARLKEGKFTPEELQNLCHNLPKENLVAFGKGCEEYQKSLFGNSYKDKKIRLLEELLLDCEQAMDRALCGLHTHDEARPEIRNLIKKIRDLLEDK